MNPEEMQQASERLSEEYHLYLDAGYDRKYATKRAIHTLKAELMAEGLDKDVINEVIKIIRNMKIDC